MFYGSEIWTFFIAAVLISVLLLVQMLLYIGNLSTPVIL